MVVNSCTAHTHVEKLKAIRLVCLPANVTSVIHPMNQHEHSPTNIHNRKVFYHKLVLKKLIFNIDQKQNFSISVFGSIIMFNHA